MNLLMRSFVLNSSTMAYPLLMFQQTILCNFLSHWIYLCNHGWIGLFINHCLFFFCESVCNKLMRLNANWMTTAKMESMLTRNQPFGVQQRQTISKKKLLGRFQIGFPTEQVSFLTGDVVRVTDMVVRAFNISLKRVL